MDMLGADDGRELHDADDEDDDEADGLDPAQARMRLKQSRRTVRELESELRAQDRVLGQQDATIESLKNEIQALQEALSVRDNELELQRATMDDLAARVDQETAAQHDLSLQLSKAQTLLRGSVDNDAEAALLEDVGRQLRSDNERLLALLTSTTEFARFADYVNDSGGVTYVGDGMPPDAQRLAQAYGVGKTPPPRRFRAQSASRSRSSSSSVAQKGSRRQAAVQAAFDTERTQWVPEEAWHRALALQRGSLPGLDEATLREWLAELNRVWTKREDARVQRVQSKASAQIASLKEKLANMRPYDDVLVDEKMGALRRTIKELRTQLAEAKRPRKSKDDASVALLASSMNTAQALRDKVAQLEARNRELARALRHAQAETDNTAPATSDAAFLRGVTWLGAALLDKADLLQEELSSHVVSFQEGSMQLKRDDRHFHTKLIRVQSRFVDALDAAVVAFRTQVRDVFESALQAADARSVDGVTSLLTSLER
ncbi:uncharacterized protein AMSG_03643 [Thecamonas trahens ATCC 50062]|uniref:Uncharacterized protein n=1 Tax=Thecamonas trahens ATCC 50062 TaxID=461836 RepID=A0A0L0D4P9_THETB|nr:hypothetical protein AMSG_03643 [Thecamonas trahens ATCC 50062]KNC47215.1 hypothetical protein AMSG_03643 [Thecamonas trahens ATCC 50062]|eukprot:XP_013759984.1 hypothetical protein AMSG_03643 [Thecamonas trahens ATCC 50062]